MSQTLLVPLDGSELGEAVLPWAVALARGADLSLTLVRVISPWPASAGAVPADGYLSPAAKI